MDVVSSRQIESARQMLFADALVLKTLCNKQALDDLEEIRSSPELTMALEASCSR